MKGTELSKKYAIPHPTILLWKRKDLFKKWYEMMNVTTA